MKDSVSSFTIKCGAFDEKGEFIKPVKFECNYDSLSDESVSTMISTLRSISEWCENKALDLEAKKK